MLIAKLTLGALAMGDQWFGGKTRSPWDPRRGSSGSSAGSASAAAAGLVGFALGSETLGSIVSPCRACGASGLRPTFGRVSRHGCMSLAWSMDKIGPIARSVEDCALVFDAIHGHDGLDPSAVDQPFAWPPRLSLGELKVGYVEEPRRPTETRRGAEGAARAWFQPGTHRAAHGSSLAGDHPDAGHRSCRRVRRVDAQACHRGLNSWPETFRQGQFVPAVEYLRAARVRTLLMRSMAKLMKTVDLYVGSGQDLVITNLTGHPSVVFPGGFADRDGRPAPARSRSPAVSTMSGRSLPWPTPTSRPPATTSTPAAGAVPDGGPGREEDAPST